MTSESKNRITRGRAVLLAALLVFLAGLVWYAAADREGSPLDDGVREELGGEYVRLSAGTVHYELTGPADGPVAVLVHGATIPSWDWDFQVPALEEAGFRVLRYDMYGRGWSDRPQVDYDRALYRTQLSELLDALGLKEPVHLVGHSMGGGISTSFAAAHPDRVASLSLISPVVDSVDSRAPFIICRIPVFGRFLVRTVMVDTLQGRAEDLWEAAGPRSEHYGELFRRQTTYEGFEDSVISMFREDAAGDYREDYERFAKRGIPSMLIWGTEDRDITREDVDWVRDHVPNMKIHVLDGAGHSPNVDAVERLNPLLQSFLEQRAGLR